MPIALITGYLAGCVSFAHILARQPREARHLNKHGAGASTVYWLRGPRVAIVVLLGDFAKAVIPVVLVRWLISPEAALLTGLGVVLGHNLPLFYGFKGGRGVAPGAGVLTALTPGAAGLGLAVAAGSFVVARNTLIASATGFGANVFFAWLFGAPPELVIYAAALPLGIAAYAWIARRSVSLGERWRSTFLRS
ncbi:MAG: glycerol-3-phosphate acyltransferase [Chloroflexi bacterium]|nr:glycerol-3-phosphate acyltransferase [Chloroflexota bacterium]